jgi:hypothetical protein
MSQNPTFPNPKFNSRFHISLDHPYAPMILIAPPLDSGWASYSRVETPDFYIVRLVGAGYIRDIR